MTETVSAGLGTMALEDGGRVDFTRLRRERLDRCLTMMAANDLDALVLGRDSNVRYVSGARRIWHEGTRGFHPGCAVVASTRAVHLMSSWDDGVPEEIPHENLYGLTWNPAKYPAILNAIPGLPEARRIGVDGMNGLFARLLHAVAPTAVLVDALAPLVSTRATKVPDEMAAVTTATAIAEAALSEAIAHLAPGIPGRFLLGRFEERACQLGATLPLMEGTFAPTPRGASEAAGAAPPLVQITGSSTVAANDLVAMHSGCLYAGYEGSIARTWPCLAAGGAPAAAQRQLFSRWSALWDRLSSACLPGRPAGAVLDAYRGSGEPLPPLPVVHGVGLGTEPPLVGEGIPASAGASTTLLPGMVVAITGYLWAEGAGGYLAKEVVAITDHGHKVLTTHSHGPLAV